MNDNNIEVRTLSDNVADKDELGSHQRIADGISELIETEDAGKSIALTGMWGSGKSSVIEMMKKRLGDTTSIFIYDAWAHDRDPLKRSFLENLIDHLSTGWIDKEKWNNFKEELAKRKETTEITNYSELTWFGIFLSTTAVLVPIGFVLLNQACWQHFNLFLFIGFLLTLSPIILGVGKILFSIKKVMNPEDQKKVFALLTGESTKTFKSDTYRTPDPTSIEFHEKYKEILSEALTDNDRKLLIVVDNLDRLDRNTALSMWSTMKTFLDFSTLRGDDWSERLWLIVPFDPQAMKRLWDKNNGLVQGEHGDLANSFIEKTFQLSFHVPLPILSNWVEYFKSQFTWAIPSIKEEKEIHRVYRIFRLKKFKNTSIPTPREIKIFINRIGTIYRIWHNEIPLNHIALYVAIESDGHIDIDILQNGDTIADSLSSELIGIDYRESLAAIYFNVPKDNALHILLGTKLENAITTKNREQIKDMSSELGFDKVLEEVVEENSSDWAKESPSLIAWLTNNLAEFDETAGSSIDRIWDILGERTLSIQSWQLLNEEIGLGISKLVQHKNSEQFSKSILISISQTEILKEEDGSEIDIVVVNDWLKGCLIVFEKISDMHGYEVIDDNFKCPGDALTYYNIAKVASGLDNSQNILSKLYPQASPAEVLKIIKELVAKGKYQNDTHNIVKLLRTINIEWNWDSLLEAIVNRVKAPNDIELTELGQLLSTLIDFSADSEKDQDSLKTIATNGDCLHHLHKAFTDKDSITTSLCLFILLKFNPTASDPTPMGHSLNGVKNYTIFKTNADQLGFAIEDLTGLFIDNNDIDMLFSELKKDKSIQKIRYSILDNLCNYDNLTKLINADTLIGNVADFNSALDDEKYQSIVDQYIEQTELINKIKELPFKPTLASLYGAIIKSSKSDTNDIQSFLLDGLQNLQKDDWVEEFTAGYLNLFDLLLVLSKNGIKAELKILYREALNEYKKLVVEGKEPKAKLSKNWTIFVNSLEENLRKSYIDQIIDEVIESKDNASTIINLFGQSLMDREKLSGKKDVLVNKFVHVFFEQKQIEKLSWFSEIIELYPEIVTKCNKESKVSLVDLIKTKLKDDQLEPEIQTILYRISNKIGVKIEKEEEDDVD